MKDTRTISRDTYGMDMFNALSILIVLGIVLTFIAEGALLDRNKENFFSEEQENLPAAVQDLDPVKKVPVTVDIQAIRGQCDENSESEHTVVMNESTITTFELRLTWTDEEPQNPLATNQPDEFQLKVDTPWGQVVESNTSSNEPGGTGEVALVFDVPANERTDGTWTIFVSAGDCGDILGPLGRLEMSQDTGNEYTLDGRYTYLKSA